jgi:DNA-3-methyladenine glycosylase
VKAATRARRGRARGPHLELAPVAHRREALPRSFFERPVLQVARDLLGTVLVRDLGRGRRLEGRIVEVEAYDGERDAASHAFRGRTPRTEVMFGEPGRAYVYFVYGMHCCLNAVTGPDGDAAAVLIRALAPLSGERWMDPGRSPARRIASGPGRLTRAFRIDLTLNRTDLCRPGPLYLAAGEAVSQRRIVRGERIGVEYAGAWARKPWRFGIKDDPALSRAFPSAARTSSRASRY